MCIVGYSLELQVMLSHARSSSIQHFELPPIARPAFSISSIPKLSKMGKRSLTEVLESDQPTLPEHFANVQDTPPPHPLFYAVLNHANSPIS